MGVCFPHRWTSAMGADPRGVAGRAWATALAGMSRDQIEAGFTACRNGSEGWPPSLPEFRALCLGIPTLAQVKLELRGSATRSLFTHLTWQLLDTSSFSQANGERADRMLSDAYKLAREHVMSGGALPATAAAAVGYQRQDVKLPPAEHRDEVIRRAAERIGGFRTDAEGLRDE